MNTLRSFYLKADATELAEKLRQGDIHSRELVQLAIDEIERKNPALNAVIYKMYDEARQQAEQTVSGPFAGVPILLKDDNDITGTTGSVSCAAFKTMRADGDSQFVSRLRQAGFIFMGKVNMPEMGLKNITEPELHGPCRNPHNTAFSPGGSSGGSGAAVAAGMVPVATGSDGGGSIRIPSAYCGLVGLKPSRGRVSVGPKYREFWEGFSTNGLLTRTVRDSAALLDLVGGYQPGMPYSCPSPQASFGEAILDPPDRLRIAFSIDNPGVDIAPQAVLATLQTAKQLDALGHHVEQVPPPVGVNDILNSFMIVCCIAVSGELARISKQFGPAALKSIEPDTRVLDEIGKYTRLSELYEIRLLWQKIANTMADFHRNCDVYMIPTTAMGPSRIGELDRNFLDRLGLKFVFATHTGWLLKRLPLVKKLIFNNFKRTPHTMLANITGQPAVSLPLYYDQQTHLPWGVQFMAGYAQEATLLQLAAQLEQTDLWQCSAVEEVAR